jgi:hypothetical protein
MLTAANLGQYPRTKSTKATETQMKRGKLPMSGKQPNSNSGGAEWRTPQAISSNGIAGMMWNKPNKPNHEHPF